jgi:16S rRNA (guanine1207-N2)-methyltransferase
VSRTHRPDVHTYTPSSQVLLRNRQLLRGSQPLVVNFPSDGFLPELQEILPAATITGFTYDYSAYLPVRRFLTDAGMESLLVFGPVYAPADAHDAAIIFLPKGKLLTQMVLALIAPALEPQAPVFLVGQSNAGIRSSRALLEEQIGPAIQRDAARHSVLYQAALRATPKPFDLEPWTKRYQFTANGHTLTVVTLPGVFSHGELDPGTTLLLQTLDASPAGCVLDFGCGAGVLGAAIKRSWSTVAIELVDSDALALEAARRTLLENGLAVDALRPSDVFSDVSGKYGSIISNPPFHAGVATDYGATTILLQQARNHLEPGGSLRIVANHFLKYQPQLETYVGPCRVIAEDTRYRVYEAVRR